MMRILKCAEGEAQNREREVEGLRELQPKSASVLKFAHALHFTGKSTDAPRSK